MGICIKEGQDAQSCQRLLLWDMGIPTRVGNFTWEFFTGNPSSREDSGSDRDYFDDIQNKKGCFPLPA